MVETAGNKLRRARELRQLSIEDASRATKIRARQLADLEADEYSNFANLAYARSFLVAYGKYLHVDTRPYMEAFADANTFGLDDYQYLSEEPLGMYRSTRRTVRRKPKRHQILAACLIAGLLAVGLFGRIVYNTYERLGDVERITARREAARAHGTNVKAGAVTMDQVPAGAAAAPARPPSPAVPAGGVPVSATPVPDKPSTNDDGQLAAAPAPVELPALTVSPSQAPTAPAVAASVPLPGDGTAVRELMSAAPPPRKPAYDQAASTTHRAPVFGLDEPPQPQKVVNNDPARPVN